MKISFLFILVGFMTTSCATTTKKIQQPSEMSDIYLTKIDGTEIRISKGELDDSLKKKLILIRSNPAYAGLSKKYHGYSFKDFLKAYDPKSLVNGEFWVEVTTHDGWKAPIYSSAKLFKGQAFLAIEEDHQTLTKPISKDGKWSLVTSPKRLFYPGPYYLVWNDDDKNPDILPLQVLKIKNFRYKTKK